MRPYRGYTGTIEFDEDDLVFHGRVVGVRDIVSYEADNAEDLVKAFHDSVDDFLEDYAERDEEPAKPFSGNLSLRMSSDLHKSVFDAASARAQSVNQWITETLADAAVREVERGQTIVKS